MSLYCLHFVTLVCSLLLKIFWQVVFHNSFDNFDMLRAFVCRLHFVVLMCSVLLQMFLCVVFQCGVDCVFNVGCSCVLFAFNCSSFQFVAQDILV